MWVLLTKRFRMWLILAIGVPLADWLLGRISDHLRAKNGDTKVTRGIDTTRSGVRKLRRRG